MAEWTEALLEYDQVEICYRGIPAVRNVSVTLHRGEILSVVGESGSGKSTLIRAAMGLLGAGGAVTRGDIWYKGMDLPDLPDAQRRLINGAEIAMIFQNAAAALCPVRTVGDQLYESYLAHRSCSRKEFMTLAGEILSKIGLRDVKRILNSFPFELSGGMNQRAGIAGAMLLHPAVLLADEPTSALDVSVQKQVMEELLLVRERFETSIILVTHNIGLARAMADRVLVMKDGAAIEYGDREQVLRFPQQEYTRNLIAAVPELRRRPCVGF